MAFKNSILAGETIARDSIQSLGYVSGVSGWSINRDGTAEFLNVVIRGDLQSDNYVANTSGWKLDDSGTAEINELTARGTVQSSNYVANTSGWKIDNNGDAEFNDILARGTIETSLTGRRIAISPNGFEAEASIEWHSGLSGEGPAFIQSLNDGSGNGYVEFFGNVSTTTRAPGDYDVGIQIFPSTTASAGQIIFVGNGGTAPDPTLVTVGFGMVFRIEGDEDVTLSSTNHPFQIGPTGGVNIRMDGNELMAVNNGAINTLALNATGGRVTAPTHRSQRDNDAGPRNTVATHTTYQTASSNADITLDTGVNGVSTALTFWVSVSARAFNNTAGNSSFVAFEIRETNAAGAVILSANDGLAGVIVGGTPGSRTGWSGSVTVTTAASQVFIRPMFKSSAATQANYENISINAFQTL